MKNGKRYFFEVQVGDGSSREYRHAYIKIFRYSDQHEDGAFCCWGRDRLAMVEYQANRYGENLGYWYGGEVKIESESPEHLADAVKAARAVMSAEGWRENPLAVVQVLRKQGVEVAYRADMGEFYPIAAYPQAKGCYMVRANGNCLFKVFADEEEDARQAARAEFAQQITKGRYVQQFAEWVQAGQQVERVNAYWTRPNDPRPAAEKLSLTEEGAAEKAASSF